ncbi:hypothetical protein [Pontibacter sp. SGAir0037]|uniref:hypothetical protein n=1 Tax=Pontibacter sp. SGAir0037 TaxID=2571030 RepID=UPI0010CD0984|nr:hypothetical protein [Pontibacter sp. SGAir0037]QCR21863.1 hypothetical protein C1N53_05605 [Pontibacter sp. SGAir0037]
MKRLSFFLLLALFSLAACKETFIETDPGVVGYGYYPLEVGDYRVYSVTDIKFLDNEGDTSRFQLKEEVAESFVDQTNTLVYKIIRSVRPDAQASWVEDSVMVVAKFSTSVILTKDNVKSVKLVFPVKNGKAWSADAYNNRTVNSENDGKEKYTYASVGEPFTVNGSTYNQTLTVVQGKPASNFIMLSDRKEVYAQDIGMIYRLFNKAAYCNQIGSSDCPYGEGYILNGHKREEVLLSYGKM